MAAIERAKASVCLYGHLHAESQWATAIQGVMNGVTYRCVAADALGFRPLRIGEKAKFSRREDTGLPILGGSKREAESELTQHHREPIGPADLTSVLRVDYKNS